MARSSGRRDHAPAVITAARHPKSLDVETRTRRYLWSMLFRTVAFLAMIVVPGLWLKLACLLAAMFIPPVAVLLANNAANHADPVPESDEEPQSRPALAAGHVIRGDVVEDDHHPAA